MEHDQERECELWRAAVAGDSDASNELLCLYEDDALRKAWSLHTTQSAGPGIEALRQLLLMYIWKSSIPLYDPDRGVPFVAWVYGGWKLHRIGIPKAKKGEDEPEVISTGAFAGPDGSFTENTWMSDPTDPQRGLIVRDFAETLYKRVEAELPEQQEAVLNTIVGTECPFQKRVGLALLSRQMTPLPQERAMRYYRPMSLFRRRTVLRELASMDSPSATS